jgi:hypothetical protein
VSDAGGMRFIQFGFQNALFSSQVYKRNYRSLWTSKQYRKSTVPNQQIDQLGTERPTKVNTKRIIVSIPTTTTDLHAVNARTALYSRLSPVTELPQAQRLAIVAYHAHVFESADCTVRGLWNLLYLESDRS